MSKRSRAKKAAAVLGITFGLAAGAYLYAVSPHHSSAPPESAEGLLDRADALAWNNRWADAQPLYAKAQHLFDAQHRPSKALYAAVSQLPPDESVSLRSNILRVTEALQLPEAQDPETRLRLLTIRGGFEIDYDAAQARSTWQEVERLALKQGHLALATRAVGDQGIAAFILGDTETAKDQVTKAWSLSKVERDPAATVRYASVFGVGLVQFHRYKEALTPLNEAIKIAAQNPQIASPTIAIYGKIDALKGLHQYDAALRLANESLSRLQGTAYDGHKTQVYISRGSIDRDLGNWNASISDYNEAINISRRITNPRGIADAGGLLAQAYEHEGNLSGALASINEAIQANTQIPDELYIVPRNLAIKAEIVGKMGNAEQSDVLYRKSIALVDNMLQHAATAGNQRQLLVEMSDIYSGYFASLSAQKRYDEALQTLEKVRGRIETDAIEHHESEPVHAPTPAERDLNSLNVALIQAEDPQERTRLLNAIYNTELRISPSALAQQTIAHPVRLAALQRALSPSTVLIEYVLAEPASYAFAITRDSVTPYSLPSKSTIETDANRYRKEILAKKQDAVLAGRLFSELLGPVKQYGTRSDLIIVPDGALHLLPFAALKDGDSYVLSTHTVDVTPSATVFDLLQKRVETQSPVTLPYVGVAAWTQPTDNRNPIVRAISGPQRSQLVPLPESQAEVETIAKDLPHPSTILLGSDATETRFKHLDLKSTEVVHLALHGYVDLDYPDRSSLVFAPDGPGGDDDGLLQVREIRGLHLNARLVTLSACNTGVGPVGETGVTNLVNAFIEAGADSVVSTLWEVDDHAAPHVMETFYTQLAAHKRKVDALRTAQLEMLNQGLAPYFWASFQIVGDPNGTL